ncbi:MAG: Zn-ribbon domain-containing OB-fold protein [Dehalococcoidia bacterium]|nr:MAG: Zn-ribbon domain-containing OB-fold protein [Dehalococcoidia bacterium]UCG84654.1 MAG: Zn-ribbon domain-containing OB-fold protein [Dehalococcoidia bacterium]
MGPYIDLDNQVFWENVKQRKLTLQRCSNCGNFYHIPRPMCPQCKSMDTLEWVPSSGRGHIYSYVTFTSDRMAYPAMKIPYVVVLVELEEGVRLTSNVVDMKPEDVYIGMPVEVVFEDLTDDLTVYKFKKREG